MPNHPNSRPQNHANQTMGSQIIRRKLVQDLVFHPCLKSILKGLLQEENAVFTTQLNFSD